MSLPILTNALFIFVLRLVGVSMGTVRTVMIMRGMRKLAALMGFVEVTIWVVAISKVIGDLDTVWNVIGYSGGFAAGTLLGMWIEDKLALGYVDIHVVSADKGQEIARCVREAGYGATQLAAHGQASPVYMVRIVAPRKQSHRILDLIDSVDPASFVTVEQAQQVLRGYRTVRHVAPVAEAH